MMARFLNVDVDLHDRFRLPDLLRFLEPSVLLMSEKEGFASFEVAGEEQTLEDAIIAVVKLVQALPAEARSLWDDCDARYIDIGIQSAAEPHSALFSLSQEAVALLASVKAAIRITVYAAQRDGPTPVDTPF